MNWAKMPSLSALRAFESAARHQSFSLAGSELNVTHAAVSQHVRHLEEQLGVALVVRHGRGVTLTAEGEELAAGLAEGFGVIRETVEAVEQSGSERPLHVSLTPSFAVAWLMPRIGAFRAAHPEIELMLNPTVELVDLRRSGFDLAIRFGIGPWAGVESELLIESRFVMVVAASLLEKVPIENHDDLSKLPWLQELGTDEIRQWLMARGIDPDIPRKVTHLPGYMMMPALREGQGLGITARVFVEEDIQNGMLVPVFDDADEDMHTGYHLVYRRGPMRPSLRRFIAWMRECVRAETEGRADQNIV